MTDRETAAQIESVATDWAIRADDRPLSTDEQSCLEAWLDGDIRRLGAYARVRAGFVHVARAKALGSDFDPELYRRQHRSDAGTVSDDFAHGSPMTRPTRRRSVLLGAVGLTAAGTVAAFGFSWQAAAHSFSTRRGEVRLVPLLNGSTMTLNTETTVRISSANGRDIELVRGEAMFDVADKQGGAFVVHAGNAKISATTGTFAVTNLDGEPVRLVVEQGSAELLYDVPGSRRRRVEANSRATADLGQPIAVTQLQPSAVLRSLAWRDGKLAFEDTPLRAAVAEFARYSDTQIVFADPAIGDVTVTGLFSANNPVGFAEAVASSLALSTQEAGGSVELRAREKNI